MKRMLLFVLPTVTVSFVGQAQTNRIYLRQGQSFTTTADTTGWVSVPTMQNLRFVVMARDSFNAALTLQYTVNGAKGGVFQTFNVEPDSTNNTNDSGYVKGYVLRTFTTDNMPGAELVRLIRTNKTTRNGITSATFDAWMVEP